MENNESNPDGETTKINNHANSFVPKKISSVEETGLPQLWLEDHTLKVLYYRGYLSGFQIAETMALPFNGVVDKILETLKREMLIEVKSAKKTGVGEGTYTYGISGAGMTRAQEAMSRSQYAGPTPVQIGDYYQAMIEQKGGRIKVTDNILRQALVDLILTDATLQQLGPAINSSTSMFVYGPPGNGKTSTARAIGNIILGADMFIPYALYLDGQVVRLFDNVNHTLAPEENVTAMGTGDLVGSLKRDPRWVKIHRPFVMVGGELSLDGLDLIYDNVNKYYEAPFQLKANGGMLLIDDFGRQLIRPRDLLNRWIVPLENHIDYLTLHTGHKIEVPFDVLVVFSTNLPPKDLVDEAFLRRIRHKILIDDPDLISFENIFRAVTGNRGIEFNENSLGYLYRNWYLKYDRKLRAVHPRDLCDQIIDIANYLNVKPEMSEDLLDRAASSYFVKI